MERELSKLASSVNTNVGYLRKHVNDFDVSVRECLTRILQAQIENLMRAKTIAIRLEREKKVVSIDNYRRLVT